MKLNVDISRFGWLLVAAVLAYSGVHSMVTMEIYGRIRSAETMPLVTGWPVFFIGLGELVISFFIIWGSYRKGR